MDRLIKKLIRGVKSAFLGYSECHGVFRVTNEDGQLLEDTQVFYRIGMGPGLLAEKARRDARRIKLSRQALPAFFLAAPSRRSRASRFGSFMPRISCSRFHSFLILKSASSITSSPDREDMISDHFG